MSKIRKAYNYLKQVGKATSLQIGHEVNTIAVGTMIADLRKQGCVITSKFSHISNSGAKVWEYEMLSWPVKFGGS